MAFRNAGETIETQIPMRMDGLPWSRFHRLVIGSGSRVNLLYGCLVAVGLMLAAAAIEAVYGVKAERQNLENVAIPLSAEQFD